MAYRQAYRSIPTDIQNLEVVIDPIMPTVLETLRLTATDEELDDGHERYCNFVENDFNGLDNEADREAVKRGLEFKGRILLSNQTGLNAIPVAFSLLQLYQEEFPVLLMCPRAMLLTWRDRVMTYFGYSKKQVIVGDRKYLQNESDRAIKRLKLNEDVVDTDTDDEGYQDERLKFLIVDVEKAYHSDIHFTDLGYKIVLMDNSDSFRFRMVNKVWNKRPGKLFFFFFNLSIIISIQEWVEYLKWSKHINESFCCRKCRIAHCQSSCLYKSTHSNQTYSPTLMCFQSVIAMQNKRYLDGNLMVKINK
jgi:hypothetical protein